MPVRALIIDYKVLERGDAAANRALLGWITGQGLDWCLFTTDPLDVAAWCAAHRYPEPSAYVHRGIVPGGRNRGSTAWVDEAAGQLRVQWHELLYVGSTVLDWRTAGNAGVLYVHALWAGRLSARHNAISVSAPGEVSEFAEAFLLDEPRWAFQGSGDGWELRCLLPASVVLPCSASGQMFRLQDVFTYERPVEIGDQDARSVLMLSALVNVYLEGLMTGGAWICVYPSSSPGRVSEQLQAFLEPASHLFHNYYREDLLVRAVRAPDTSRERAAARREGRRAQVSIATQATTVHVGTNYRGRRLRGKTVIVADDFTTHGMSLSWAQTLLDMAGVEQVILLAVGKYGSAHHTSYAPLAQVEPFQVNEELAERDFEPDDVPLERDSRAEQQMRDRIALFLA
ncbi:hypothetical protein [Actinomadura sp. K4S16]|uniref:hypothetical protein n=1 Tax=Actinomadura sp. K4S16 TaxID=1316147 RepID=UPI0011EDB888|nr:hypothetical protein [Actinomadura sp. K4S16]